MRRWSLRTQLFVLGALTAIVPLLLLLSVVYTTSTNEALVIGPDGRERVVAGTSTNQLPFEVVAATAGLGAVALLVVWRWSGRATAPMEHLTRVAQAIQAGSLDRRIGLRDQAAETQALADSFDAMLDRLEESSTLQSRLIEDISHELRTPLAALAVSNEIPLNNPDSTVEQFRAAAERSEVIIAKLTSTIDELLAEARSRTEATRQVDNDLMVVVERVVEQQRAAPPDRTIAVTGPKTLHLGIHGPSVQRALANLIDNATRYSPPDQPVRIDVTETPPTVSVTDHGPGIAPQDQPRIFDRYYSGENGVGIGLALVKQIADAHGAIDVTSPLPGLGHGTRFTIRFNSSSGPTPSPRRSRSG